MSPPFLPNIENKTNHLFILFLCCCFVLCCVLSDGEVRFGGRPFEDAGARAVRPVHSQHQSHRLWCVELSWVGLGCLCVSDGISKRVLCCVVLCPLTHSLAGLQTGAVQNMLDFDFICNRREPSVAALVYEFEANHFRKFYWNKREVLLPIYQDLAEAIKKLPEVDTVVNFASFRSVYESTKAMLKFPQIRYGFAPLCATLCRSVLLISCPRTVRSCHSTIAIIAEGVPERRTRELIALAAAQGVTIIGPATVGGIKPGAFRIGNTGGMLDNIIDSRLYRAGSVAYVARSGGMSNELNNM
jgi:hypothetical protein